LNEAINTWESLEKHPLFPYAEQPFRLKTINDIGALYIDRYFLKHKEVDLDRAISLWKKVVADTPADSEFLPSRLSNLGVGLINRSEITYFDESDLGEGITFLRRAVSLMPEGSSEIPTALNNLGCALLARFNAHQDPEDVDEAIDICEQAVKLTPEIKRAELARNAGNLCRALSARYRDTGRASDMERINELTSLYGLQK
jgi:tetratricopeptide (TPR) repeat protein